MTTNENYHLQNNCFVDYLHSPLGIIRLTANGTHLLELQFCNSAKVQHTNKITMQAKIQLHEYFNKTRKQFDVPLNPQGTPFQKQVWNELLTVPFGKTISYHQLSLKLGNEKVIRAAANANSKNPVAILIPCHRVIGSDGSLTGYAGGLWRKQWLLDFESGVQNIPYL